jgi:hypothetical protein
MHGRSTHIYMPSPSHPTAIFHSRSRCGAERIHKLSFPPRPPVLLPPTAPDRFVPRGMPWISLGHYRSPRPQRRMADLAQLPWIALSPRGAWAIASPLNQELLLWCMQPIALLPKPRISAPLLLTIVLKGSLIASHMLSSCTKPWGPCLTKVVFVLSSSKCAGQNGTQKEDASRSVLIASQGPEVSRERILFEPHGNLLTSNLGQSCARFYYSCFSCSAVNQEQKALVFGQPRSHLSVEHIALWGWINFHLWW